MVSTKSIIKDIEKKIVKLELELKSKDITSDRSAYIFNLRNRYEGFIEECKHSLKVQRCARRKKRKKLKQMKEEKKNG